MPAIFKVATLDRSGSASYCEVTVTPGAPRAHLVINEVMANPAGDEPSEEWIEILQRRASGDVTGWIFGGGSGWARGSAGGHARAERVCFGGVRELRRG